MKKIINKEKECLSIGIIGASATGKKTLMEAIIKYANNYLVKELDDYKSFETERKCFALFDIKENGIDALVNKLVLMDGALLVVDFQDKFWTHIREYLLLLKQVGVEKLIIYINKCDLIDDKKLLGDLEVQLAYLLCEYGYDDSPIIRGSAKDALDSKLSEVDILHNLVNIMDSYFEQIREDKLPFLLPDEIVNTSYNNIKQGEITLSRQRFNFKRKRKHRK